MFVIKNCSIICCKGKDKKAYREQFGHLF